MSAINNINQSQILRAHFVPKPFAAVPSAASEEMPKLGTRQTVVLNLWYG